MIDFEARSVIEALRSGVSSKSVGQYFSSARPALSAQLEVCLQEMRENKQSGGMIISGKYGEGKTHFLKNAFHIAQSNHMVVSFVSLSKETPFDKLYLVYQKLIANTYLPGRMQPGFEHILNELTPVSPLTAQLLEYSLTRLETNKLYFLLKSFLNTDDEEEKFRLLSDLEGDFIANGNLKQIYKRIFAEKANFSTNFSKTKHAMDYFGFFSHLFTKMGYDGWLILFDETELIGRLGKKSRLTAYKNMHDFLGNEVPCLEATYSLFAMSTSFVEDVIESKHEYANLENSSFEAKDKDKIEKTLASIATATRLSPLTHEEIAAVLQNLKEFHAKAYDWNPTIDMNELLKRSNTSGHLLRTKIRTAVELLDQLYQYGQVGAIKINELGETSYEPDPPLLDSLLDNE